MLRRGAATAADYLHAILGNKPSQISGQLGGRELVDRAAALVLRQAGVGQHADGKRGVLAEKANRVVHFRRAGGAVEANHVGLKAFKDGQRRADFRTKQHGAGSFQSDLDLERNVAAGGWDAALASVTNCVVTSGERDLGLQQILAGFNQQHVHAALDERLGLFAISGCHGVVADVAQRGQLGGGANGAGDKARLVRGGVFVGHRAGQPRRSDIQFAGPVLEVVLGQHNARRTEAVSLDYIATSLKKRGVNGADHVGPREHQQLVAPLFALEILRREVVLLQICAHRAVKNQHAPFQF